MAPWLLLSTEDILAAAVPTLYKDGDGCGVLKNWKLFMSRNSWSEFWDHEQIMSLAGLLAIPTLFVTAGTCNNGWREREWYFSRSKDTRHGSGREANRTTGEGVSGRPTDEIPLPDALLPHILLPRIVALTPGRLGKSGEEGKDPSSSQLNLELPSLLAKSSSEAKWPSPTKNPFWCSAP
nr:hypothetical protein Iba_chr04eCG0990 [Ipomoea batatas]